MSAVLDGCGSRSQSPPLGDVICIRNIATGGLVISVVLSSLYTRPSSPRILSLLHQAHIHFALASLCPAFPSACFYEILQKSRKPEDGAVEQHLGQRPYALEIQCACACDHSRQVYCDSGTFAASFSMSTMVLGGRPFGRDHG